MILREMMLLMALHPIGLSVVFCIISSSLATPLPLQVSLTEGSADGEELSHLAPSPSTPAPGGLSSEYQTTPGGHSHVDTVFLKQVVNFLQRHLLFILVGATLLLVIFLMICGAVCMSRRRKVNASYYPSSFPSKMYVDQRDKNGGTKPFHEVPEKAPRDQEPEPVDSRKQLQVDIMRAAKSLRTANRSPDVREGNDPCEKIAEGSPKPDASTVDKEVSNLLEEKDGCPPPDCEAAALEGSERPLTPPAEEDGSSGPSSQALHRPSSQHIPSDSTPLQLITGEKTAF